VAIAGWVGGHFSAWGLLEAPARGAARYLSTPFTAEWSPCHPMMSSMDGPKDRRQSRTGPGGSTGAPPGLAEGTTARPATPAGVSRLRARRGTVKWCMPPHQFPSRPASRHRNGVRGMQLPGTACSAPRRTTTPPLPCCGRRGRPRQPHRHAQFLRARCRQRPDQRGLFPMTTSSSWCRRWARPRRRRWLAPGQRPRSSARVSRRTCAASGRPGPCRQPAGATPRGRCVG